MIDARELLIVDLADDNAALEAYAADLLLEGRRWREIARVAIDQIADLTSRNDVLKRRVYQLLDERKSQPGQAA